MRRLWKKVQHFDYLFWQIALRGDLFAKFLQLLGIRQFAVEEEVGDFFERRFVGHLVYVVAAIHQTRVRIDPADRRLAGNHAGQPRAILWLCFSAHVSLTLTTKRRSTNNQSRKPFHSSAVGS